MRACDCIYLNFFCASNPSFYHKIGPSNGAPSSTFRSHIPWSWENTKLPMAHGTTGYQLVARLKFFNHCSTVPPATASFLVIKTLLFSFSLSTSDCSSFPWISPFLLATHTLQCQSHVCFMIVCSVPNSSRDYTEQQIVTISNSWKSCYITHIRHSISALLLFFLQLFSASNKLVSRQK